MNATSFPATRWSVVAAAGAGAGPALETLCQTYWYPLYVAARRRGLAAHDAEDLVQDLLVHLLDGGALARARADRGRFRGWLLTCLKHRLADNRDAAQAAKRDRRKLVWLDTERAEDRFLHEPVSEDSPEAAFDRAWALDLLAMATQDLAADYARRGQTAAFTALRPALDDPEAADPAVLGAALGTTPGAAKVALHRLRSRWREALRARVADTVADPAEIDDEIRRLLAALTR